MVVVRLTEVIQMNDRDEDKTQVSDPPTLRVWWTGHMRNPDHRTNEHWYVVRSGHWHGKVLDLIAWFQTKADALRTLTPAHQLAPDSVSTRRWGVTLEMLNVASTTLNDATPSLLPLPAGCGILYVSGHVTESEWMEIRDAANGRWNHLALKVWMAEHHVI